MHNANCDAKTAMESVLKNAERNDVNKTCFPGGTSVIGRDGLTIDIDHVSVGTWVLSRNEKTGEQAYRRVTKKFEHIINKGDSWFSTYRIRYVTEAGETDLVEATAEHLFWVNGVGWVPAIDLKPGQYLEICDPIGIDETRRPKGLKAADFVSNNENWQAKIVSIEEDDEFDYRLKYVTDSGETFSAYLEAEHPFLVKDVGWLPASRLKSGQMLKNSKPVRVTDGTEGLVSVQSDKWQATIVSVEKDHYGSPIVYNFEIEEFHTYFVGHHGIWVHNKKSFP